MEILSIDNKKIKKILGHISLFYAYGRYLTSDKKKTITYLEVKCSSAGVSARRKASPASDVEGGGASSGLYPIPRPYSAGNQILVNVVSDATSCHFDTNTTTLITSHIIPHLSNICSLSKC